MERKGIFHGLLALLLATAATLSGAAHLKWASQGDISTLEDLNVLAKLREEE